MHTKHLEKVAALGPHFDALLLWGNVLNKLGHFYTDTSFFNDANDKFQRAKGLLADHKHATGEFYWKWGHCWHQQGNISRRSIGLQPSH